MKKAISIIVTLVMLLSYLPVSAAIAAETSNSCGDNLTWMVDDMGTLIISGTGPMIDWTAKDLDRPWSGEKNIKSVIINDGVTSIGDYAFSQSQIKSISISNSVTSIGEEAFQDCSLIERILIPDSVTELGYNVFTGCENLKSIKLGNGIRHIPQSAFWGCVSLTNVEFGNNLISLDTWAFGCCENLTSIHLPSSLKTIGNYAFEYCFLLESIIIESNVETIGSSIFSSCDNLSNIYYTGSKEQWNNIDIYSSNYKLFNTNITYNYGKPPFCFSGQLTNQDDEIITLDNIDSLTNVKMTLSKLYSGDHTGLFLIAFYDAGNRLICVEYKSSIISTDVDLVEFDIEYDVSSTSKIKAFAWKDLTSIQPLCEALEKNLITE